MSSVRLFSARGELVFAASELWERAAPVLRSRDVPGNKLTALEEIVRGTEIAHGDLPAGRLIAVLLAHGFAPLSACEGHRSPRRGIPKFPYVSISLPEPYPYGKRRAQWFAELGRAKMRFIKLLDRYHQSLSSSPLWIETFHLDMLSRTSFALMSNASQKSDSAENLAIARKVFGDFTRFLRDLYRDPSGA